MISIQAGMLVALGFLIASLVWLLLASAFWSRAVRLTTDRLKRSMPVSEPEIKADRDRLRAEHAIRVHKLQKRLEQAQLERARHMIEINRRDASISALETDMVAIRADVEENQNARRVLEQTVADRLPKVEARLAEAKRLLFNRDREIGELTQAARRHKVALEEASSTNAQKSAQIDRLNTSLTTRGGRSRRSPEDRSVDGEIALYAEVEALRAKTREQAALIDRLQRRLGSGHIGHGPMAAVPSPAAGVSDADLARETISEAEAVLNSARLPVTASAGDAGAAEPVREIRALKARAEDQAGEIARLKAALAVFEQTDASGGLMTSKLALKARAGSAEAQAERQTATIGRLRAELAAANERLARQAAHFMDEMRRIGGGTGQASGQAHRGARTISERRKLVDRVAQVRPALTTEKTSPSGLSAASEAANGAEKGPGNGRNAKPESATVAEKGAAEAPAAAPAAAEMPKTPAIPEGRRKLRLLDRITSLSKI